MLKWFKKLGKKDKQHGEAGSSDDELPPPVPAPDMYQFTEADRELMKTFRMQGLSVGIFGTRTSGLERIHAQVEDMMRKSNVSNGMCESVYLDEDNMPSFRMPDRFRVCILVFSGARARYDEIASYEQFFKYGRSIPGLHNIVLITTKLSAQKFESRNIRSGYQVRDGQLEISHQAEEQFLAVALKPGSQQLPLERRNCFLCETALNKDQENRLLDIFRLAAGYRQFAAQARGMQR
eukprot:tig00000042_g15424.t1